MITLPIRATTVARLSFGVLAIGAAAHAETTPVLDAKIAHYAALHGVPEHLVRRVVHRESKGNPHLVHHGNFGLMQIKYGTARSMGYSGSPQGLLDAETNLAYAVPYLANAYRLAGGDEDRAVGLYAAGYYYTAKSRHMLGALRTADSPPVSMRPTLAMAPAAREMSQSLAFDRAEYAARSQNLNAPATATDTTTSMPGAVPLPPTRPAIAGERLREERTPAEYQMASLDGSQMAESFVNRAPATVPLPPPRPFSAY